MLTTCLDIVQCSEVQCSEDPFFRLKAILQCNIFCFFHRFGETEAKMQYQICDLGETV